VCRESQKEKSSLTFPPSTTGLSSETASKNIASRFALAGGRRRCFPAPAKWEEEETFPSASERVQAESGGGSDFNI